MPSLNPRRRAIELRRLTLRWRLHRSRHVQRLEPLGWGCRALQERGKFDIFLERRSQNDSKTEDGVGVCQRTFLVKLNPVEPGIDYSDAAFLAIALKTMWLFENLNRLICFLRTYQRVYGSVPF